MTRDEAWQVLGLAEGASREEVSLAYRELAQMLHPDKFGENKRLRARAEQQMRRINEARDVLLKGGGRASHSGARPRGGARSGSGRGGAASANSPEQIRLEAEARVRAAETARLTVVAQARTMRERRRSMGMLAGGAAVVMLLCSRMHDRGACVLRCFDARGVEHRRCGESFRADFCAAEALRRAAAPARCRRQDCRRGGAAVAFARGGAGRRGSRAWIGVFAPC